MSRRSSKTERLAAMVDLIQHHQIANQEELVRLLLQKGFDVTQATISRDLSYLQVCKTSSDNGDTHYILPAQPSLRKKKSRSDATMPTTPTLVNDQNWIVGVQSIERSETLVVVRTKPGYAGSIASDIDSHNLNEVMGTIAGDDTILVIPRMGYTPEQVSNILVKELTIQA